jgi:hypothetical protein
VRHPRIVCTGIPRNTDTSSTVHKRLAGFVVLIACAPSRGLIGGCRTIFVRWWAVGGELGGGVFGLPSLSFGDGAQQEDGSGWDIRVGGCGAFPPVGPVVGTVCGLDADLLQELPNKFAAFGPMIVESLSCVTM